MLTRLVIRRGIILTCVYILAALSAPTLAEVAVIGDPLTIEVNSSLGSGSYTVALSDLTWNPTAQAAMWVRSTPIPIYDQDSGQLLATFNAVTFRLIRGSRIDVNVTCRAGASGTDFQIYSGALAFPTVSASAAQGKASVTANIADTGTDGATLEGLGEPGSGVYRAYINEHAGTSALFTALIGSVAIGAGASGSAVQTDPPSGYRAVGSDVSDMTAVLAFSLSADDLATLNSTFAIDPIPAGVSSDADGDGRPDFIDGCPRDASKLDPGTCGCGVADTDTDGDEVPDCVDNCPTTANEDQADSDGDGVGDKCESDDGLVPDSLEPQDQVDPDGPRAIDRAATDPEDVGSNDQMQLSPGDKDSNDDLLAIDAVVGAPACGPTGLSLLPLTVLGIGALRSRRWV